MNSAHSNFDRRAIAAENLGTHLSKHQVDGGLDASARAGLRSGFATALAGLLICAQSHAFDVVGGDVELVEVKVGDTTSDQLGNAVCGPGDLNGDGVPDYVIASHNASGPDGSLSGMIRAFSGADHTELWDAYGEANGDRFGHALAAVRDVNGDGVGEVAVSAIYHDHAGHYGTGMVYLLSGADGSELWSHGSIYDFHYFGTALMAAGDVNGDGFEDVAVGMPNASYPPTGTPTAAYSGRVVVLHGRTGNFMAEIFGTKPYDHFGTSGAGVGDLNADGYDDLAIGVPGYDKPGLADVGRVSCLSGKALAGLGGVLYLRLINGVTAGSELGTSVAAPGDVDQDGTPDILAGAPYASNFYGDEAGIAELFSGASGALLDRFYGEEDAAHFGLVVAAGGDMDHDGVPDLAIAAPHHGDPFWTDDGYVYTFSGRTGAQIFELDGFDSFGEFGSAMAALGDLNGDGTSELLIGEPLCGYGDDENGRAEIHALRSSLYASKLTTTGVGDSLTLTVEFDSIYTGHPFQVLLSLAGEGPSVLDMGGEQVPLTADSWTLATLSGRYPRVAAGLAGYLGTGGKKTLTLSNLSLPGGHDKLYMAAVRMSGGLIEESSIVQIVQIVP